MLRLAVSSGSLAVVYVKILANYSTTRLIEEQKTINKLDNRLMEAVNSNVQSELSRDSIAHLNYTYDSPLNYLDRRMTWRDDTADHCVKESHLPKA